MRIIPFGIQRANAYGMALEMNPTAPAPSIVLPDIGGGQFAGGDASRAGRQQRSGIQRGGW